jgi:hypothetical protein
MRAPNQRLLTSLQRGSNQSKSCPLLVPQAPTPSPQPPAADSDRAKRRISAPSEDELDPGRGSLTGKFEQKPGINGQINVKNKRFKGSPGGALARSIDNFTKVYASMAAKALEVEERIAKDKADTNLQMLDIKLKYQTELEKLRKGMQDP